MDCLNDCFVFEDFLNFSQLRDDNEVTVEFSKSSPENEI